MGTPLDTFTASGITYDRIVDRELRMSEVELKQARQVLWKRFQDDLEVMYYLGQFYRRRADLP